MDVMQFNFHFLLITDQELYFLFKVNQFKTVVNDCKNHNKIKTNKQKRPQDTGPANGGLTRWFGGQFVWLVGWLISWVVTWVVVWLIGWLVGRLVVVFKFVCLND